MRYPHRDVAGLLAAGLLAAIGSTALPAVGQAATTIVNIDARSATGTTLRLAAGDYTLTFVGKGGGGLFDGWNPTDTTLCLTGDNHCTDYHGWTEVYKAVLQGTGIAYRYQVLDRANGYQAYHYATAADALQVFQANTVFVDKSVGGGGFGYDANAFAAINFHLDAATAVTFSVPEDSVEGYADNQGGVSLALDGPAPITGAPEPAGWALMLTGVGAMGAMLRSRRRRDVTN